MASISNGLLGGTVDTNAQTITVSLSHFSEYALFGSIPPQSDSDADGVLNSVDNCPNWSNPLQNLPTWPAPAGDTDCDGFTTAIENFVGTDPNKQCGVNAWPVDLNNDGRSNLSDVLKYSPVFNTAAPGPPYNVRYDLNADGRINLSDLLKFSPFFNKSCSP